MPEEIRLRRGEPAGVRRAGKDYICGPVVQGCDLQHLLLSATGGSLHCAQAYLAQGFLPLPEGGRLGICGLGNGYALSTVTSVCIRLPQQVFGCADTVLRRICCPQFTGTIIISPPGLGKTTLLREMIRRLSQAGYAVSVCDPRGEISGRQGSGAGFDLGPRTDVSVGDCGADGAVKLLRTMSPQILAMDELTAGKDRKTLWEAVSCGVELLSTVHGDSARDLQRPGLRELVSFGAFTNAVEISLQDGQRHYEVQPL